MYCPNCATRASADQRFCRSCGLNLEAHAKILAGQPAAEKLDDAQLERQISKLVFWGLIGSIGGLIVAMLGDKAIGSLVPTIGQFIEYIGRTTMAVGVGLLVFSGIRAVWFHAYGPSANRRSPQPTALPEARLTARLPPEDRGEPAPSVTEHTTESLEVRQAQARTRDAARQKE